MNRPIALGLAPNIEEIDAKKALQVLLKPFSYNRGQDSTKLQRWFKKIYNTSYAFPLTSARGGLFLLGKALHLQKGDEVLIAAFTCKAIIDPILALGLTPVYIDLEKDFTLSEKDILHKITPQTKLLIVQHTFGIPALSSEFLKTLKKKGIVIVEDMAHGIGIQSPSGLLGGMGDATIFSFGRDKAFSSVSGGMVITNSKKIGENLEKLYMAELYPSFWWTFQQLFHSVSFYYLILPFYDKLKIGKILLVLFQKLHLLSLPVEKHPQVSTYTKKLPNVLCTVILLQLSRLSEFNNKRESASEFYRLLLAKTNLSHSDFCGPLLRYPLLIENPLQMKRYFRRKKVYLGDWYSNLIDPKGTDREALLYKKGSCPTAEYLAQHILNLPTYPTLSKTDLQKVGMIIEDYAKSKRNS